MTTYLPGGEMMRYTNGTVVWHSYVMGEGQHVGEVMCTTPSGGAAAGLTRYYVNDCQGPVSAIVDNNYLNETTNTEFDSYDAWGKRRFPSSYAEDWNNTLNSETVHGYTNQEHLTDVGLIHLNARVYDPYVGRFLSVDPVVGMQEDLQSWNGYSYAGNNPMAFTDPSGMCFLGCFWKQSWFAPLASIAVAITFQYELLPAIEGTTFAGETAGEALLNAAISGAVAGAVSGGTWQSAALGGLEAAAFFEVGSATGGGKALFGSEKFFLNVGGHALVGGTFTVLEGGKFGAGALAAGFSGAAGPYLGRLDLGDGAGANLAAGTFASAVIGGTSSVLGGGKFANGAETGAFSYLYNDLAHAWAGTVATYALAAQLNARDGGQWQVNFSLWGALEGRLDLLFGNQIFEIKTNLFLNTPSCLADAKTQLAGYIAQANEEYGANSYTSGNNATLFQGKSYIDAVGNVMGVRTTFEYLPFAADNGLVGYNIIDQGPTWVQQVVAGLAARRSSQDSGPLPMMMPGLVIP